MLDRPARQLVDPLTAPIASILYGLGVRAGHVTAVGLIVGLGSAASIVTGVWAAALVLWISNRCLDGIDGPIARIDGATDLGGYLDFVADYVVYVSIPLAIALAVPDARLAVGVLFGAYLLNIVQLLTLSSIASQRGDVSDDGRALIFGRGLMEGTETIIAYVLLIALHQHAAAIALIFALLVLGTACQRFAGAVRLLRAPRCRATDHARCSADHAG